MPRWPPELALCTLHATALGGMCSFLWKVFEVLIKVRNLREKGRDCSKEAAPFPNKELKCKQLASLVRAVTLERMGAQDSEQKILKRDHRQTMQSTSRDGVLFVRVWVRLLASSRFLLCKSTLRRCS